MPSQPRRDSPTFLIVDDDARCRRLVRQILDLDESVAWEGSDGHEAIALYRKHHPNFVIMDIEMDGMDGITATHAICAEDATATIIAMSKHEGAAIETAVSRAGACRFLPKLHLTSLPAVVDELTIPADCNLPAQGTDPHPSTQQ